MSEANSDELAEFISSTLKAIATGIHTAQESQISSAHGSGVSGYSAPKEVEFDVAVSAKRNDTAEGGLKVAVFGIGANAKADSASESATVSRIRFSVPLNFKSNVPLDTSGLGRGIV